MYISESLIKKMVSFKKLNPVVAVAVLLADNTFVLAAFHLLLPVVAIGLLLLYFYVCFLHESYLNFKLHYLHIIPEIG